MDKKQEMIEKLRLVFDVGTGILPDNARIALAEVISALQSSVVLPPSIEIPYVLSAIEAGKENGK